MSYISFTAAVSPASGPLFARAIGSGRSCGTKAERYCGDVMLARSESLSLRQIPVENFFAVPRDNALVGENVLVRTLYVADTMRHAREIRMAGNRHDLRPLGRLGVEPVELVERAGIHHVGSMMLQRHHDDV